MTKRLPAQHYEPLARPPALASGAKTGQRAARDRAWREYVAEAERTQREQRAEVRARREC